MPTPVRTLQIACLFVVMLFEKYAYRLLAILALFKEIRKTNVFQTRMVKI